MAIIDSANGTRDMRLRARIDFVMDERDQALESLWDERAKNERLEERNDKLVHDVQDLRRSREMWKQRAQDAEAMVGQRKRRPA